MAAVEKIIGRLSERKVIEAVDGLKVPRNRDAFELGRLVGIQHGLTIAQSIVEEAIGEDENDEERTPAHRKK